MIEPLIQVNCKTGVSKEIYPVTVVQAIKNQSTGEALEVTLERINHLYLPFKNNSKASTRLQVQPNLRRRGLWVTYISCLGNITTEIYNSDDFSDQAWSSSKNWTPYLGEDIIQEALRKVLTWYKN